MNLSLSLQPSPSLPSSTPSFPLFPLPNFLIFQLRPPTRLPTLTRATHPQTLPHSAIQRIADKLRSLGFSEPQSQPQIPNDSAGEIFIPLPNHLSKYRVGHTLDPSWSTPENPVPSPGSGNAIFRYNQMRAEAKEEKWRWKRERVKEEAPPTLAELTLSKEELRRLITAGIKERRKLKVGKAGVTEGVVNGIHERWRRVEVVKIVCEDLCRVNMKRTHDLLERKTGGLVVWRSGSKIILYRGENYKYPYFALGKVNETLPVNEQLDVKGVEETHSNSGGEKAVNAAEFNQIKRNIGAPLIQGVGSQNRVRFQLPGEAQLAEEAESLLEGLGPRFTDWWGCEPFPVDADLLPPVVPGYRRPFRLLPYGVKPKLTNDEMTTLKRLGRPLPCHFALGRNKKHQGLAASIVKLWEKCEIAKIAIKRGVQNTNSEMMAEELKWLTGGTLLSRDRDFIVLYRGKDFLPSAVSSAIEERRKHGIHRFKQLVNHKESEKELVDGAQNLGSGDKLGDNNGQKLDILEQKKLKSIEAAIKRTSFKLSMSLEKKAKAEKLLMELEIAEAAQQPEKDKEGISEEERYMLRKVGLKMKPFLLLGRRGVFDGTVENMHLHWKYRELVKVICKEKSLEAAQNAGSILEAESGGILVAVERVSKGYAIIVYRGKNYIRPARLRPSTLLNKKEAMKRSLEAQRRESLKIHVLKLNRNINDLKLQLVKDKEAHNMQMFGDTQYEVEEGGSSVASNTTQSGDFSNAAVASQGSDTVEAAEKYEGDIVHDDLHDSIDASADAAPYSVQADLSDCSSMLDENETGISAAASLSESVTKETRDKQFSDTNGAFRSVSGPENFASEEQNSSTVKHFASPIKESEATAAINDLVGSGLMKTEENNQKQSAPVQLTNKERLLLRRQALKMRKRPVLAVGRSNVVTGVAKTIKTHFEKYPLAIVNVKGRAKRTSVQEIVFKLEQATGAVLVSQEPSKVILYRGWGADLEPGHKYKKITPKMCTDGEGRVQRAVSPELLAAIRLECGLQNQEEQNSSAAS